MYFKEGLYRRKYVFIKLCAQNLIFMNIKSKEITNCEKTRFTPKYYMLHKTSLAKAYQYQLILRFIGCTGSLKCRLASFLALRALGSV